jgi:xanthine dehydrogenase small subunit
MRDYVRFFLNGQEQIVRGDAAFVTLAEYLRLNCGLPGTKIVCAEGDCGACTVLVGRANPHPHPLSRKAGRGEQEVLPSPSFAEEGVQNLPVDACIQFIFQLDGTHVVTVERLTQNGDLHPVQQAMVDCHGSQCGYCTPGFVMALAGWAANGCKADQRISLTGNLCRCTGYVPILEATERIRSTVQWAESSGTANEANEDPEPLEIRGGKRVYFAPTELAFAVAFKAYNPDAAIVAGATELGVWRNKRGIEPGSMLSLARIAELNAIETTPQSITFGANVTWSQVETALRERLPQFRRIIERFGSPQIRNVATLAGNIANGSPIADSLPLLMVMDAQLEIVGPRGSRARSINGFYTGYKKMDLRRDELIARVILPLPKAGEKLRLYKVSRRTDLDISTFGAAIRIHTQGDVVRSAAIAYAGVAPTVVRLPMTEAMLVGRPFDEDTFREAGRRARAEVTPITDVRGSADFRLQLCENVLRKFYHDEAAAEAIA